jgi:hypothetical protein
MQCSRAGERASERADSGRFTHGRRTKMQQAQGQQPAGALWYGREVAVNGA